MHELQKAKLLEPSATVFLLEGLAFENVNNHQMAYNAYDNALKLDNDIFDAHKKRSIYRYEQKDWAGAYADIAHMIRLQPKSAVPYRLRGMIRGHQQDYKGAIEDLTHYLEFDSTDLEVLQSRAVCRNEIRDHQGALNDIQVVFAKRPTSELQEQIIRIKIQMGDTTGAWMDLDRWSIAMPQATIPFVIRAELSIGKKDLKRAEQEIKQAYKTFNAEFYPGMDSEITMVKGRLMLSENKPDKAISLFSQALRLDPFNDMARYYRGKTYLQTGKKEKAVADFEFLAKKGKYDAKAILDSLHEN
jgi:tetratricopeptide (TPR) repeat protein